MRSPEQPRDQRLHVVKTEISNSSTTIETNWTQTMIIGFAGKKG